MKIDTKALEILKEKEILDVDTGISMTSAVLELHENESLIEVPLRIIFSGYTLLIYNKWSLAGALTSEIKCLKGGKIVDIISSSIELRLKLSNSKCIVVDLTDNGFVGPESLVLYGPDNLIIVWN